MSRQRTPSRVVRAPIPEPTFDVVVMAHPRREAMVHELVARLGTGDVVWDRYNDRIDTGTRCLTHPTNGTTHRLIIQDDAIVPFNFHEALNVALTRLPQRSIAMLYVGNISQTNAKVRRATRRCSPSWLVFPDLYWGVGLVLPVEMLEPAAEAVNTITSHPNFDRRLGVFARKQRIPIWCPWPSLVDHRDSPSLLGRAGGRHALNYAGDIAPLDWSKGQAYVPR